MKSLWGRFKPAQAGPSTSRPSPDVAVADRSDDTIKVGKTRSFRRPRLTDVHTETPTSASGDAEHSHSHDYSTISHSSLTKELPPRPVTPGALANLSPPVSPKDSHDLPNAIEEWRAQQARASNSTDNVKKVAFQSPQRPHGTNSDGDLRGRAAGSAGPSRQREHSPTSRSSSRNSVHGSTPLDMRRGSASTSQASLTHMAHSPTKSTLSQVTLAPSESSATSAQSYIPLPESWTAAMDDELIANLGPRERARQEVLWEIVNSEERYVQDLAKLNETFCLALLPARESPPLGLGDPLVLTRTTSPVTSSGSHDMQDFLPIASQYSAARQSTDSFRSDDESSAARMNALAALTRSTVSSQPSSHPQTISHNAHDRNHGGRLHGQARTLPLNRASRGNLQNKDDGHSRITSRSSISSMLNGPMTLPDDLEQVLTSISSGILQGHVKLVTALRKRYDEQFPLVRSLADVFISHSDILREYATYILHLERALAQIDEAAALSASIATGSRSRRSSRRLEETQQGRLSKRLAQLEELAAQRGEAGMAISLSKPFQRLLKYPLLFQNLLFNTSPSTREYEATLAMVDEVETIVRSIEDEKSSSEERERARDAWARIEGIERHKQLMAPKPTRLLVSETLVPPTEKKGKASHRLSEMLKYRNMEQWIVRFTDVSLLCERTGYTSLPTSSKNRLKSESQTDLSIRRLSSSKRGQSLKQRNMYRFLKVYEWHERVLKPETPPPRLSLDYKRTSLDVMRRASVDHYRRPSLDHHPTLDNLLETPRATGSAVTPRKVPMKTVDGSPSKLTPRRRASSPARTDDAQSEVMSVMSFAFRGEARPLARGSIGRARGGATMGGPSQRTTKLAERRASGNMSSSAAANAKFAHRLRSSEELSQSAPTIRPASRVRRSLPPAMALTPAGGRRTTTPASQRPPWNNSMRPISAREERELEQDKERRPPSATKVRPKRPESAAARSRSSASEREPFGDAANGKDKMSDASSASSRAANATIRGPPIAKANGGVKAKGRGSDIENVPQEEEVPLEQQKGSTAVSVSKTNVEVVVDKADKPAAKTLTGVAARIAALEGRNRGRHI
ncbi:hypothetical protein CcaverHIS002_0603710 [Cutaneotrichosporon cavernicola]|uniref:DH domain-containing protein n=1 Tax=Cutaneotrichosporon cavernicola TaxID=279322 RepID=A0AA48QY00_9TREE|nr:uncharacterized protein CcaverHIS019_0603170 [Cutaneotrichosporon cavernicola]BEI86084.1 hypothetical protein CcaverHIS002_0603710 [Cutaneotrichosporon cavernicola]BEI93858.1 hypothetical protein CcaverHIS019_0603170 [Cutaneotrichosporon cavernicola]